MRRLAHGLSHWLGWQPGIVVAATDPEGVLWIGYRCTACGRLSGVHASLLPPADAEFR